MRLEKLELHGFKSFADKTEFVFQPGLTAFIGPNGCGKSNVVDAVKWVLGEQSVKSLRGNEMTDVIFNGTSSRRSVGYAEATLTFSNAKGLLPTDYEQVAVTRRLYRSGESEYYINKQRCRLRDIRGLFMDTGIGMDAYSIIEQGKIGVLLTTNKQDRRAIFEEAAGISKYKAQKRTCLAKLDRVDHNLQRLGDIIDEVEKRMRSVKYQAAKARRWKRLDEQHRELAIALALHDYRLLLKDRDESARQLAELNADVEGRQAVIERMEAELSEFETAVIDANQKISELEAEDVRISGQLEAAEEAIRMNERRIGEQSDLEEQTKAEIAKTEATLEMMRGDLERAKGDISALGNTITVGGAQLSERRAALKEIDGRTRALRAAIDEKRLLAVDLASERSKHRNDLSGIAAQREQLVRRDRRFAERSAECHRSLDESTQKRDQLARKNGELEQQIAERRARQDALQVTRDRAAQERDELSEQFNARQADLASVNSRCELLSDLEQKLEGVGEGVRHLLEASQGDSAQVTGIHGLVADLIDVDAPHAAAIEVALGANEQLVLTDSLDAATNAMAFLAREQKGQAAFLPLDGLEFADRPAAWPQDPGIVGPAVDLVRGPDTLDRPLRYLLGDVLVVRDLATARRLAASNGHGQRYATLDGQLFSPHGISVGGTARGISGVISRRSELRALEVERATLDADIAVLGRRRQDCAESAAGARQQLEAVVAELGRGRDEQAALRAELGELDAGVRRLEAELEANESERAETVSNLELLANRESVARDESARVEQAEAELQSTLAQQEAEFKESEAQRDQSRDEISRLEIAQAEQLQRAESLRQRVAELTDGMVGCEHRLETARHQVEACRRRRGEADQAILDRKRETAVLLERRGRLGLEKAEASNRRELVGQQFQVRREERSTAGREAKEAGKKLNELNVHVREIALRIENLESRTESELACSLAERQGQGPVEELDWDAVATEIETLRGKMRSMGSVNTYAIEELEELEARAAELRSQREDLQRAEQKLKDLIRRINRRSRELFQKTYDDVRANFQELFRKLFGGGRADVILEPDVDILDAGVDIIACPPGKEPASITLLSGGEKAMTAVALLFAIFKSKPSPFCILDEVDAPLDEHNIERFCMLVRDFLRDSQFIVITHSRRTMAMADALYGVTMQEPGISTKVAVKFDDDNEAKVA